MWRLGVIQLGVRVPVDWCLSDSLDYRLTGSAVLYMINRSSGQSHKLLFNNMHSLARVENRW